MPPEVRYFIDQREACGWGRISVETARAALDASSVVICVTVDGQQAGFGRAVGDGCLAFYIQDVVVDERFRGLGLGRAVIEALIEGILASASDGASIGLMSAPGKEAFYNKFGFLTRPENARDLGAGMSRFVSAA